MVTADSCAVILGYAISIHTTRKVVTIPAWGMYLCGKISIHTTRKVVTTFELSVIRISVFQSTPPARW